MPIYYSKTDLCFCCLTIIDNAWIVILIIFIQFFTEFNPDNRSNNSYNLISISFSTEGCWTLHTKFRTKATPFVNDPLIEFDKIDNNFKHQREKIGLERLETNSSFQRSSNFLPIQIIIFTKCSNQNIFRWRNGSIKRLLYSLARNNLLKNRFRPSCQMFLYFFQKCWLIMHRETRLKEK